MHSGPTHYFILVEDYTHPHLTTVSKVLLFQYLSQHFFCCQFFADELVHEKEKYKYICDDLDMTFTELIEK